MDYVFNNRFLVIFRYVWMLRKKNICNFNENFLRPRLHPIDVHRACQTVIEATQGPKVVRWRRTDNNVNVIVAIFKKLIPNVTSQ